MDRLKKLAETVEAVAWAAVSLLVLRIVWDFMHFNGAAK